MRFGSSPQTSGPLARKLAQQFAAIPQPKVIRITEEMRETARRQARKEAEQSRHYGLAQIIRREVAERHDVSVADMDGPSRNARLCKARFEAMYEVTQQCTRLSFPQIGRLFGNRDHTTILNGVRKHGRLLQVDKLPRGLPLLKGGSR